MTPTLMAAGRLIASARTRAALSLGVVLAVGATGTFAYWTDAVPITGATFTAGTIDLQANGANSLSTFTAMNLSTMVPGNSMAGVLTIKNNGNVPLKYTATSSSNPAVLSGALTVKVTGDAAVTGTSPAITCAGAALPGSASTLGGSTPGAALISTGRQLAPGASETICIQVTLPAANTDTSLQGATSAVTFNFSGTSDLS